MRANTLRIALLFLLATTVASSALAQVQLVDQNSSMVVVTNSSAGINDWMIDGAGVLNQQWFWYRVGDDSGQSSIDTLPAQFAVSDTNPFTDPHADTLSALYTASGFTIQLKLSLQGGAPGSKTSDLAEQINITNTSGQTLDFHFFQYCDFSLSQSSDSVQYVNSNTVQQSGGAGIVTETVFTPAPNHHEAALDPTILTLLTGGTPATLNDSSGAGPGNTSWANEWDVTLGAGQSLLISKDKHVVVPEPSAFVLAAAGLAGLLLIRRRTC